MTTLPRSRPDAPPAPEDDFLEQVREAQAQLERLWGENQRLAGTEEELRSFKEKLAAQMRMYRRLYEIGRRFNETFEVQDVLEAAARFVVDDLQSERCAILLRSPDESTYRMAALAGYPEALAQQLRSVSIPVDDPCVQRACEQDDPVAAEHDPPPELAHLGTALHLCQFTLVPLGVPPVPSGLMIAGTSGTSAPSGRDGSTQMGLANLAGLISTAMRNVTMYRLLQEERLRLEEKVRDRTVDLESANENLKKLDRLKTAFFANVSHELRTPLTLSVGPLEVILKQETSRLDPAVERNLRTVYNNQLRLLKLINDLLDFAKLEAGRVTVRFRREEVVQTLQFYLGTLQAAADARKITLGFDAPTSVDLWIDRDQFEKIVMNLLSNAFKFTPEGGAIIVCVACEEQVVRISVIDDGMGIPKEAQEKIFDRFSQVDGSGTGAFQGTGIGLAMVKEFMEIHGGTVSVQSELGQGSNFTLEFRRGRDHLDPALVEEDSASAPLAVAAHRLAEFESFEEEASEPIEDTAIEPAPAADPELTANAARRVEEIHSDTEDATVLVVDDSTEMRRFIGSLLKQRYRVITANDGQAGLELARKRFPDLIVSDVMMPRMNGFDLCRAIKTSGGRLGRTPVILLTAKNEMSARLEGLEHGADDFLVKPFNADELLSRSRNLIKVRRQERELFLALRALEERDQAMNEDLAQARSFQQSILPRLPNSAALRFASVYRAADMVGGDVFDVVEIAPGRFRGFMADAPGHGVQASLRTMIIKAEYDGFKWKASDPAVALTRLNHQIASNYSELGLRFTACCFDVDVTARRTATVTYANAGHLPLVHVTASGVQEVYQPGPFLGMVKSIDLAPIEFRMAPRERLFVFTDGLVEAWDPAGRQFPEEDLHSAFGNFDVALTDATGIAVSIFDDFLAGRRQEDDVTLLGLEFTGQG